MVMGFAAVVRMFGGGKFRVCNFKIVRSFKFRDSNSKFQISRFQKFKKHALGSNVL